MSLRHRLHADGVFITLGSHGRLVSVSEAKRFAWALLADLDPDEAEACGAPEAERKSLSAAALCGKFEPRRALYLHSLLAGPKRAAEVAERIGEDTGVICARLAHLANLGLVERVGGGGKGTKVTWALTAEGRSAAASSEAAA